MKNRLYEILGDLEEITKQLSDLVNVLEIQSNPAIEEIPMESTKSLIKAQIRLLNVAKTDCESLHVKIDNSILDIAHNRIEL